MQESFLHHIWSLQYFDKTKLLTTEGEIVSIFSPGTLNTHAGPDFSQARLRIGEMNWVGNVEIHIHSSGWTDHHHEDDPAYDSVILHVVWLDDKPVLRRDRTRLPTMELRGRIAETLVRNYRQLIGSSFSIPCRKHLPAMNPMIPVTMFSRSLAARLERKAEEVVAIWSASERSWEETTYQVLAGAFGFKVNRDPFLQLARAMPWRILQRHQELWQVEALLFGQAGFLEGTRGDAYYLRLRKEYQLLAHKYGMASQRLSKSQWLFLRLRPSNFPTLRIAQFAAVMNQRKALFSFLQEAKTAADLANFLSVPVSPYWNSHFRFNGPKSGRAHQLGQSSVEIILVNTVAPLLAAYARYADSPEDMDRAVHLLEHMPAEENGITRRWTDLGLPPRNALEAQGQIELFNTFCREKRCMQCAIGAAIIRPTEDDVDIASA
jgi:hypothetical protein